MGKKSMEEELVTVKVRKHVKDHLLEIQGLLMYKDHRPYSQSDIIEYALSKLPPLEVPLSENIKLEKTKSLPQTPERT